MPAIERPERRPLVPSDLYTGEREVHLRVGNGIAICDG
jgi:hypothetical protein